MGHLLAQCQNLSFSTFASYPLSIRGARCLPHQLASQVMREVLHWYAAELIRLLDGKSVSFFVVLGADGWAGVPSPKSSGPYAAEA